MRKILVLVLAVLMFCVGAAFSYHNPQVVEINFLAGHLQLPLGALLMTVVASTALLVTILAWVLGLPRRAELMRLKRRLERTEKELDRLRSLPLGQNEA